MTDKRGGTAFGASGELRGQRAGPFPLTKAGHYFVLVKQADLRALLRSLSLVLGAKVLRSVVVFRGSGHALRVPLFQDYTPTAGRLAGKGYVRSRNAERRRRLKGWK
jgi:hypothetical protein